MAFIVVDSEQKKNNNNNSLNILMCVCVWVCVQHCEMKRNQKFMVDIEMNDDSQETNNNRPVTDV